MTEATVSEAPRLEGYIPDFGVVAFSLAPTNPYDESRRPEILEIRFRLEWRGNSSSFCFHQVLMGESGLYMPAWSLDKDKHVHDLLKRFGYDNNWNSYILGEDQESKRAQAWVLEKLMYIAIHVGKAMAIDLRESITARAVMRSTSLFEKIFICRYLQNVTVEVV